MVSQPGGRHVLPHQEVRNSFLPPDRREPLGGRTTTPTGHRHTRATRPPPADRTTRRPVGLGRSPGPVRPPPLRSRQGTNPHPHHTPHRTRPDLRAALAADRLPTRRRATPGGAPLRVRRRASDLPHRPPSPLRPR